MASTKVTKQEPAASSAPAQQPSLTYQPNVDICDRGAEVLLVADIPGARADGIDVSFEEGVLSVHAAVPARELPGRSRPRGVRHRRATAGRSGSGDDFDASQITAELPARGVLTIHVPRLAAVRPRKVEVRAG
jgi:HSP20 family protein